MLFDKIFLHRLVVPARIGCREPRHCVLEVDMEASIDLGPASSSDNLSDTTDYASFAREVSVALEVARYADFRGKFRLLWKSRGMLTSPTQPMRQRRPS